VARRLERDLTSEILLNERQREIHAGRHAGRRRDVPVPNEDGIGLDRNRGIAPRERRAGGPVCRSPPTVEQTRLAEQEGAGAATTSVSIGSPTWSRRTSGTKETEEVARGSTAAAATVTS
jgi:hypothetical protein